MSIEKISNPKALLSSQKGLNPEQQERLREIDADYRTLSNEFEKYKVLSKEGWKGYWDKLDSDHRRSRKEEGFNKRK